MIGVRVDLLFNLVDGALEKDLLGDDRWLTLFPPLLLVVRDDTRQDTELIVDTRATF